jgi:protocatechuate 3,4-dioxygenase beta subunit
MGIASARRAPPELVCLALAAFALGGAIGCRRRHERTTSEAPPGSAAAAARLSLSLLGQVVDGRARPVPEARVLAFRVADGGTAGGSPGGAAATADLDGHFSLEGLPPGTYRLLVEAAGFPAAEASPVTPPAADLVLHVAGEGRSIFGRVARSPNQPVVGARVVLGAEEVGPGGPGRETLSRADGRFAFSGLGDGTYALRALLGDEASATVHGISAGRDGVTIPQPLVLRRGATIGGRLVQDTGDGLAGFEVRAESAALPPGDDPLPVVARSDKAGGFKLGPLAAGSYRVTAARAGYVLRRSPTVTFAGRDGGDLVVDSARGETPPLKLELLRGARVAGQVTDARGVPAASAHVRCVASAMDDLTVGSGPLPLAAEAAALPSGAGRALGTTRSALADAHGRFTVDDLIPGRYRVEVAHAGAEPLRTDEITLAPGERRDLGSLALRDGFPIEGRVVDETGAPIDGARVAATGGADDAGLYAATDGAGSFSIALPAGHYRLTATAPGHGGASAEVDVRPGAPSAAIALRLARAEAILEGLVRDTGGRPLGRARLLAWSREGGAATPIGTASADVGGHFRMADLPAGELRLEVQHPDYPRVTLSATPGQFASLTVPFPGGIAGEAHVRGTGAPVTRGRVDAAGPEGAKASAELQRAGSFRLPRLAPGRWRLSVSAPGYHPTEQELDVPPSASLGEPSVRDLRVDLDPV